MTSLVLALALAADGGTLDVCPDVSAAEPAVELDGGVWLLPPPRGPRMACRIAQCEEELFNSKQAPPPPPLAVVVAFGVGVLVGGVAVGYVWYRTR